MNEYSHGNALKTVKKREIESRLATEINEKIVTSKEDLKKYAKILKLNPKGKKTEKKNSHQSCSKHHQNVNLSTKRTMKDKMLSPKVSKFMADKKNTEMGPSIKKKGEKDHKGLKKCRQNKSTAKWKF